MNRDHHNGCDHKTRSRSPLRPQLRPPRHDHNHELDDDHTITIALIAVTTTSTSATAIARPRWFHNRHPDHDRDHRYHDHRYYDHRYHDDHDRTITMAITTAIVTTTSRSDHDHNTDRNLSNAHDHTHHHHDHDHGHKHEAQHDDDNRNVRATDQRGSAPKHIQRRARLNRNNPLSKDTSGKKKRAAHLASKVSTPDTDRSDNTNLHPYPPPRVPAYSRAHKATGWVEDNLHQPH